jgi:YidC/Oxa1 family membrane protein insertase
MDRRTALAIFLFISIYYAWLMVRSPGTELAEGVEEGSEPAQQEPAPVAPAPVAPTAQVPERTVPFEACGITATATNQGGSLSDAILPGEEGPLQVQPLYAWLWGMVTGSAESPWKPWGDPPGPQRVLTADAFGLAVGAGEWSTEPLPLRITSTSEGRIEFQGRQGDLVVRHAIEATDEDGVCVLDVSTSWTNEGSAELTTPLWVGVHDRIPPMSGGMLARYDSRLQPVMHVADDLYYGSGEGGAVGGCMGIGGIDPAAEGVPVPVDGTVDWFGVADRYYGFLVVNRSDGGVGHFSQMAPGADDDPQGPVAGSHLQWQPTLAPGGSHQASLTAYVGPLDTDRLVAIDESLGEAVDLGLFAFFGYPLLWLLRFFHGLVGNWGVAIILLTVVVKALFFPMTQASFRSMQKMQQIQPEMQRIREEYADNPQEMNKLTMELMAREQVNPLSGCLPMVVQMPVWFSLYQVLLTSVDLYHTDFLYLRDLSAPDPYCILPVAVMVMMLVQQSFTNTANMDPAQARVMRFMPLIFGAFFFTFPSGLAVYVFVNMLLSIAQQWWIKRSLGEAPAMPAA